MHKNEKNDVYFLRIDLGFIMQLILVDGMRADVIVCQFQAKALRNLRAYSCTLMISHKMNMPWEVIVPSV